MNETFANLAYRSIARQNSTLKQPSNTPGSARERFGAWRSAASIGGFTCSVTSQSLMDCESSVSARPTPGRQRNMAKRRPLIDAEDEVRELTAEELARAVPFSALPQAEQRMLKSLRRRGPQKAPRKVPVSIRLSADVADGLRATGQGWQRRADGVLRSWLQSQTPRRSRR